MTFVDTAKDQHQNHMIRQRRMLHYGPVCFVRAKDIFPIERVRAKRVDGSMHIVCSRATRTYSMLHFIIYIG